MHEFPLAGSESCSQPRVSQNVELNRAQQSRVIDWLEQVTIGMKRDEFLRDTI